MFQRVYVTTTRQNPFGHSAVDARCRLNHAAVPFDAAVGQGFGERRGAGFGDLCTCNVQLLKFLELVKMLQPGVRNLRQVETEFGEALGSADGFQTLVRKLSAVDL